MSTQQDLTFRRGQTEEYVLTFTDDQGALVDLTTASKIEFEVKYADGDADPPLLKLDLTGGIVPRNQSLSPGRGLADLTASATQTFALPVGYLRYDVYITRLADGGRKCTSFGNLISADPVNFP